VTEVWLPVPDWPYEVSDQGRVRSVERTLPDGRTAGSVILRPSRERYPSVTLRDGWRRRRVRVHRLVKLVHTGPPRGRQVRHLDDDKQNTRLKNLKYGTQKDNERDKKRNQGQRERGRTRERGRGKEKIRETGEIGRSFPGGSDCVISCFRRPGP
jgi:NUMOD4 motif/HNH endonuclease